MQIPRRKNSSTFTGVKLRCESLEDRRLLAVFTVSNLDDAGIGSLRQAVLDANELDGLDQIEISDGLTGVITLSSGELHITDDLPWQVPARHP